MKWLLASALAVFCFTATGCKRSPGDAPYVTTASAVPFDLNRVGTGTGIAGEWIGTYSVQGKVAHFKIAIGPLQGGSSGITFAKGRFVSVPDSDATALLAQLKIALEAKSPPIVAKRVAVLPFTLANLGDGLSRLPDGSFAETPRGGWTPSKIFLEDGDGEDVELFLNLNPSMRKGEFSIKDADYGDAALAKLAGVL
jgi:hypothetical protein